MYNWPFRLLAPQNLPVPQLVGSAAQAGVSLSQQVQAAPTDGGGFWRVTIDSVPLWTPQARKAWAAWERYLQAGVTRFILPLPDLARQPRPLDVYGRPVTGHPHMPGTTPFNWPVGYGDDLMVAALSADAALRATSLQIDVSSIVPFTGGESLSILHPAQGWRYYDVIEASDPDDGDQVVSILPPLRQAAASGTAVELDFLRMVAKLDPANSDMTPAMDGIRATGSATFVEAFF